MKVLWIVGLLIAGMALNQGLVALHTVIYNVRFEACKAQLIKEHNYLHIEQAFACVVSPWYMKVLGTLLFAEGSIL